MCTADVASCKYGNRTVMAEQVDGSCTYRCNISEQIESTVTVLATYSGNILIIRNSTGDLILLQLYLINVIIFLFLHI